MTIISSTIGTFYMRVDWLLAPSNSFQSQEVAGSELTGVVLQVSLVLVRSVRSRRLLRGVCDSLCQSLLRTGWQAYEICAKWALCMLRQATKRSHLQYPECRFTLCSYWKKAIPLEELLAVNNKAEEIAWKLQADAGVVSLHCS